MFEYKGRKGTIEQFAAEKGLNPSTVTSRINLQGMSLEEALETPIQERNKMFTYKGKRGSIRQFSEEYGINQKTVVSRMHHQGMNLEEALETKIQERKNIFEYKGKKGTAKELAKMFNTNPNTVCSRMHLYGFTIEEAIETEAITGSKYGIDNLSDIGAYKTWSAMRIRCLCKSSSNYKNYGGRGIKICPLWLNFLNFYEDMGDRPEGYSIERIDVNGNYCPENCKWISLSEQGHNKRSTKYVKYAGKKVAVSFLAKEHGINPSVVHHRLRRGWSVKKAVTTLVGK